MRGVLFLCCRGVLAVSTPCILVPVPCHSHPSSLPRLRARPPHHRSSRPLFVQATDDVHLSKSRGSEVGLSSCGRVGDSVSG